MVVRPRPTGPASGLTLVELLVGLALTAVMLASLTALATSTLAAWRGAMATTATTEELLAALDQITRDVRHAGYDPRESAGAGIAIATGERMVLTADLDGDGTIDRRSSELIAYRRSRTGSLLRVVGRQAMPQLGGLTSDGLALGYLDDAGRALDPHAPEALDDIAMVTVRLAARADPTKVPVHVAGGARLLQR